MTRAHINWTAATVLAFCLGVWAVSAGSTFKLGKVYQHRGAYGFRYALLTRIEKRLHLPITPAPAKADEAAG
jgi:hypothetical protein